MSRWVLVSPQGAILRRATYPDAAPPVAELTAYLAGLARHKPRWLPVVTEGYEPFDPVAQVREGPVETVEARRLLETWTVRDKSGDELAAMRAAVVAAIKAEATRRILAIMPETQQRNALALGMEMVTTIGPDPADWPAEVQAIHTAAMAAWTAIKDIRALSNQLEASVPETAAAIAAFDPLAGWDD